ncbi:hypothetical protein BXZ70DRAFT_343256 [Cristinia sonorae]|uniref:Putative lipoate-protein ligase A n=1 Tax=Cristinia sonorae TaxID=1940300 RepID=A0A8K0UL00_9AGAR|nr:hypothetical protein BXZ70DRAFT_343256 [Cristinia sonorae]
MFCLDILRLYHILSYFSASTRLATLPMHHLRGLSKCYPRSYRRYTTGPSLSPSHSIYVSKSTNPYFNLSLEDWLFRHKNPQEPLLLLYRNSPCVVIGRNQNPWAEVNLSEARARDIPWLRRRSGGGAVYHDLGNTNFSIHTSRTSFDRRQTARTIQEALRHYCDIPVSVNDRNDFVIENRKVSGSAYKIVNNRAYHHGTMLIDSKLESLGKVLSSPRRGMMKTKGVESVRSPVVNLREYSGDITHDKFVNGVIRAFRLDYDIDVDEEVQYVEENSTSTGIEYIHRGMEELKTWDWQYGQTPEFTYTFQQTFDLGTISAELRSKHGVILECAFACTDGAEKYSENMQRWSEWLKGRRFGFVGEDVSKERLPWKQGELATHGELGEWLHHSLVEIM